jgi:TPR repeat protein
MTQAAKREDSNASPAENADIGRRLLDKGEFAQARAHLEAAVQAGDAGAACHLGEMTLKGQGGISLSQDKAAALFQMAQSRGAICFSSGK